MDRRGEGKLSEGRALADAATQLRGKAAEHAH
jgi:hypothetical protein